jgi:hypothetical protein
MAGLQTILNPSRTLGFAKCWVQFPSTSPIQSALMRKAVLQLSPTPLVGSEWQDKFRLNKLSSKEKTMALDSFKSTVLADGPIGYWRLGEKKGSVSAADASGHGNCGTYSYYGIDLEQTVSHGGDTAARFDGQNGRIIVLNSDSLNPPHRITMEALIRWDGPNDVSLITPTPVQQRILEKSSYVEQAQYGLSIQPDGHVRVEIRITAAKPPQIDTTIIVETAAVVTQGVETHIVATYDGQHLRIYLDGAKDPHEGGGIGSISPKPPACENMIDSGLGIGNTTRRDRPFKGLIDEVALYPQALSPEQVRVHYKTL